MRFGSLVGAFFLLAGGAAAAAGQASSPAPGTRIRVTAPCAGRESGPCRTEGVLVRLQADSITIALPGSTAGYGRSAISRLETSRGLRSHRLLGAGAGLLVGAGTAVLLLHSGGSTSLCDRSANQDAIGSGECLGLTALGGLAGAGLGVLVGGLIRTERWEDTPLDRLRVSLTPERGGTLTLAAAVTF